MGRRNIYDLLEEKTIDYAAEYTRLSCMLRRHMFSTGYRNSATFYEHIKEETFFRLPIRETCIDLEDLLKTLGINLDNTNASLDELLILIEFILCVYDSEEYGWAKDKYEMILKNIGIILKKTSHKVVNYKKGSIVIPKDAKIEEAAILAKNESISLELLDYNHKSNIGNIENKEKILSRIAKCYETDIRNSKSKVKDDISFILNNFNIRHNNEDGKNNKNTKFMNGLTPEEIEELYDKLYTLFIFFIIQTEQEKISTDLNELKRKVLERTP